MTEKVKVAFQGEQGAYSHLATLEIFPNYDHRIAMSFFCLGLLYNGTILVNDFKTVDTSFSKFLEIMKKIGAKFEVKKRN